MERLPGVTDREYYTNSFHIPVWYSISAYDKIRLEAPYHALCNAGHISYVELDGDTAKNVEAFETVVRWMHDCGVGYGEHQSSGRSGSGLWLCRRHWGCMPPVWQKRRGRNSTGKNSRVEKNVS